MPPPRCWSHPTCRKNGEAAPELFEDDTEWDAALTEAGACQSAAQMRQLFVVILTSCGPNSPRELFDKFWTEMAETWAWRRKHAYPGAYPADGMPAVNENDKHALLFDLEARLANFALNQCLDYGLPKPDPTKVLGADAVPDGVRELREARDYDQGEQAAAAADSRAKMDTNPEQRDGLARVPGEPFTFFSADSVAPGDDQASYYPVEFLNSLRITGLPLHEIKVKVGCVLMLLRNLDPKNGLCNGTRFVLTRIHDHMLEGVIITGDFITQRVLVPRITLQLSDSRFPFTLRRRQFPVRVAFA